MTAPLDPEYHTARLLLLIDAVSGRSGALDGLTKLAKLDFLIRYPTMLRRMLVEDNVDTSAVDSTILPVSEPVESRMIRYKYGPWDNLYYPLVGALVAKGLVERVSGRGRVTLRPTSLGLEVAAALRADDAWTVIAARCGLTADHYDVSGNALKERIYAEFPDVVDRPIREVI